MNTPYSRVIPVILISLFCDFFLLSGPALAAPPANDHFTNRTSLAGMHLTASGTNNFATRENGEPNHAGQPAMRSLWWSWRPPADGMAELLVTNVGTPLVRSAVYTGDALTNLSLVVSNAAPTNRTVSFLARAGDTYQLAVDQLATKPLTAFDINLDLNTFFFSQPVANSRLAVGVEVALAATNSMPDQTMTRVDYHAGTNWIAGSSEPPFVVPWFPSVVGNVLLRAIGTNSVGQRLEAATLVTVTPVNDQFSGRILISGLANQLSGDSSWASREAGEPAFPCTAGGRTLWWSYTAAEPGLLRLSDATPPFRSTWALYGGDVLSQLSLLKPGCKPAELVLGAGETVQIAVDTQLSNPGTYTADARFYPVPANDSFASRVFLNGTNPAASGDTYMARSEPGEPVLDSALLGHTVWYAWVAPATGRASFSASFGYTVGVYTGTGLETLQLVTAGINGDSFLAQAGTTYHLQLDTDRLGTYSFGLQLSPFTVPLNDYFTNATPLSGFSPVGISALVGATAEPYEPAHLGAQPYKSVWWRWQAVATGQAWASARKSLAQGVTVAVYTGSSLETLVLVAKGAKEVEFSAQGGTTYYIAAVTAPEAGGDVYLEVGGLASSATSFPVPGNLLCEWSFENTHLGLTCWGASGDYGGYVNEYGGADGTTWPMLVGGTKFWQDFVTVPGRTYQVKFAFMLDGARFLVKWNDQSLGIAEIPLNEGSFWHWTNFTATATGNTTRLLLDAVGGNACLDAVSVVWMSEPPSIVTQPLPASTFEGATASFLVGATGTPPLSYQWYFNGVPLLGKTSQSLLLDGVSLSQAGQYGVVVTNAFGSVTSAPAVLVVEKPAGPSIVLQPYGEAVAPGGYFALCVVALGRPPLFYQWYCDGVPVLDATNRHLVFTSFAAANAGTYTVKVWNAAESAWSLPASLSVGETNPGGGIVLLANTFRTGNLTFEAPVFDVDGVTRLSGTNYVAQLYAGKTLAEMRPAGEPTPFHAGSGAGLFNSTVVFLPTVPPGSNALTQIRVWDRMKAASYEEARAVGSKFGRSIIMTITAGGGEYPTDYLRDLQSFSLSAGLPQFVAGRLQSGGLAPDGTAIWELKGEAGYRYVIERSTLDFVWRPLLVLTNASGIATFVDPAPTAPSYYRARILD